MSALFTSAATLEQTPYRFMEPGLFEQFRAIAYTQAGIAIKDGKEALVSSRVQRRIRALGLHDAHEYLSYLKNDDSGDELVHFLDAISTNFTSFFREREHFAVLSAFLEHGLAQGKREWKIWSAAASSGEEPYSIAITCAETLPQKCSFKILATDISTRMLAAAREAVYDTDGVSTVPVGIRNKYFSVLSHDESNALRYAVVPKIRERVLLRRLNLSTPPFPMKGPLDIVFCRNVMIYFDTQVRQRLIAEVERLLADDGLLLIGHAETLSGISHGLSIVKPSIFAQRNIVDAMKGLVA